MICFTPIPKLFKCLKQLFSLRHICLILAWLCYGIFGQPTPDSIGLAESMIAVLLFLSIININNLFRYENMLKPLICNNGYYHIIMLLWFVYPVYTGFIYGQDLRFMARDIMAVFCLVLPFFLAHNVSDRTQSTLLWVGSAVGFFFAFREIMLHFSHIFLPVSAVIPANAYLSGAVEVSLAACVMGHYLVQALLTCPGQDGWRKIPGNRIRGGILVGMLCGMMGMVLYSLYLTQQRAALAMVFIYIMGVTIFYVASSIRQASQRMKIIAVAIALGVMGLWFHAWIGSAIAPLLEKNRLVGNNARLAEFSTILEYIGADLVTAMFGMGWGARFANPAVGLWQVGYSHSLISYLIFKTGLAGVCIYGVFMWQCLRGLGQRLRQSPALAACIPPLILSLTLYANYKSLGYGLVLTVLSMRNDIKARP